MDLKFYMSFIMNIYAYLSFQIKQTYLKITNKNIYIINKLIESYKIMISFQMHCKNNHQTQLDPVVNHLVLVCCGMALLKNEIRKIFETNWRKLLHRQPSRMLKDYVWSNRFKTLLLQRNNAIANMSSQCTNQKYCDT